MNYYSENDPKSAAWLAELMAEKLIPAGKIDTRSITDVNAKDLLGFTQCHFFSGIAGWPLALRIARWPEDRPVWTGSCPCQPFSAAGQRKGSADERHLWPVWFELIKECRPQTIIGEQVASSDVVGSQLEAAFVDAVQRGDFARANKLSKQLLPSSSLGYSARWLDGIFADLESACYACGAADIPAACKGAPHIRQRLYWMAHAKGDRRGRRPMLHGECEAGNARAGYGGSTGRLAYAGPQPARRQLQRPGEGAGEAGERPSGESGGSGDIGGMADADDSRPQGRGCEELRECRDERAARESGDVCRLVLPDGAGRDEGRIAAEAAGYRRSAESAGCACGLEHAEGDGREQRRSESERRSTAGGCAWSDFDIIPCADGKVRRIPRHVESGFFSVADGLPTDVDAGWRQSDGSIFPLAKEVKGRVGLLKGFGNAIVPQLAAEFIRAAMEAIELTP